MERKQPRWGDKSRPEKVKEKSNGGTRNRPAKLKAWNLPLLMSPFPRDIEEISKTYRGVDKLRRSHPELSRKKLVYFEPRSRLQ